MEYQRLYIGLVLLLTLGCPNLALAEASANLFFRAGLDLAKKNQLSEAQIQLETALKAEPANTLFLFNYGNILFLQKNYSGAANAYREVAQSKSPLAAPAKIYLGKCEAQSGRQEQGLSSYREGRYEEAANIWERVAKDDPSPEIFMALGSARLKAGLIKEAREAFLSSYDLAVDSETKEAARDLVTQINDGLWHTSRKIFPEGKLAFGYDNNFYADAKNGLDRPVGKAIFLVSGSVRQILRDRDAFQWRNRYSFSLDGPISIPEERTIGYGLETALDFNAKNYLFAVSARFDHYFAGTSAYYMQPGINLKARRYAGPTEFGLDYILLRPIANANEFNFLSGVIQEVNASVAWNLGRINYGAEAFFRSSRTGDYYQNGVLIPLRYHAFGPAFFLSLRPAPRWDFSLRAAYELRTYPASAQPGDIHRLDNYLTTSVYGAYRWAKNLQAFARISNIFNRSTLGPSAPDDKNYNQCTAIGGLTWSYE